MWVWREDRVDTAGGAFDGALDRSGGWRLDVTGAWTWDDGAPRAERGGADPRRRDDAGGALALLPAPVRPGGDDETPIFRAVSDDHSRRALHPIDGAPAWAAIPEPHPGSGPLPVQDPGGRRLAAVPTVPPPAVSGEHEGHGGYGGHEGHEGHDGPVESPEDEMRRRAERRRRGRSVDEIAAGVRRGRHALRADEPRAGRHSRG